MKNNKRTSSKNNSRGLGSIVNNFSNLKKTASSNLGKRMNKYMPDGVINVYDSLNYPNIEELVQLYPNGKGKHNFLENGKYLDENNFHLQIGKMKKKEQDGSEFTKYISFGPFHLKFGKEKKEGKKRTLYNDITLGLGIEYMIKHTKKGEHSIIQIWSDVGDCLQPGVEEGIMSAPEQKEYLETFIEENFGRRGEAIKVVIGPEYMEKFIMENLKKRFEFLDTKSKEGDLSENEKSERDRISDEILRMKKNPNELFNTIKEGRKGIIPKEEPILTTPLSPLTIIQYLAYRATQDEELMRLSYETKPKRYQDKDKKEGKKPGDSDADFYGIVEVGLRLYEVLNGVSIQGGLGRQRVYDKIISLIVNGKDNIDGKEEFDSNYKLTFHGPGHKNNIKYRGLYKLHKFCEENYKNTKFYQLYIELSGNNGSIDKVEKELEYKDKLISKIKKWGYGILIAATLISGTSKYADYKVEQYKENQKKELNESIKNYYNSKNTTINLDELSQRQKDCLQDFIVAYQINELEQIQQDFILATFKGFSNDYYQKHGPEVENHEIINEFSNIFGELMIMNKRECDPYHDLRKAIEGTRDDIIGHLNPNTAFYKPGTNGKEIITRHGPNDDDGIIECEKPEYVMRFNGNDIPVYEYRMNGETYQVIVVEAYGLEPDYDGKIVLASKTSSYKSYNTELGNQITNDLNEKYPQKTSL